MGRLKPGLVAALVLAATAAQAQAPGTRLVFTGCPMMRNTTPVPCWLGRFQDRLYYLGSQGDLNAAFYPPQFNHPMLVEGIVADAPAQCGGVVLRDVHVSVLPEIDPACNVILPAEGWSESDEIRGPGPSGVKGHPPEPPRRPAAPAPFSPPFAQRSFTLPFDAGTDRLWREAQGSVNEAVRYAQAAKARSIEVTGRRAAIRLSDGKTYVEPAGLAEARAKVIDEALHNLTLPAGLTVKTTWVEKPGAERSAVIVVRP